jgi:hypothetical protein
VRREGVYGAHDQTDHLWEAPVNTRTMAILALVLVVIVILILVL